MVLRAMVFVSVVVERFKNIFMYKLLIFILAITGCGHEYERYNTKDKKYTILESFDTENGYDLKSEILIDKKGNIIKQNVKFTESIDD